MNEVIQTSDKIKNHQKIKNKNVTVKSCHDFFFSGKQIKLYPLSQNAT